MDRLARAILGLRGPLAYALIFGLPALEASAFVGLVFPGELAVLLGGVLAFQGRVSLAGALAASVGGAVVGDSLGYAIGSRFGERLFATRLGRRLIKPHHRQRAEELIRRRGAAAVFFGRLSALLRVLVPGLAGMSGMPYGRFLWFNVVGAVVWAGGFTLLGYAAGNAWRRAARAAAGASVVLAGLLLVVGLAVLVARWLIRHEEDVRLWWLRQIERPQVVRLRRRYERQLAYLHERLDPRGAFGLYLTIGLGVSLAMGWALGAAVQDLLAREELVGIDRPVAHFVAAHRAASMTAVMRSVTVLGSPAFVAVVMVAAAAVAVRRSRSIRPAAYLAATVLGGYALERALKLAVHRVRPLHAIAAASGPSFPSGHTVAAVTLYGGMAFVATRLTRSWKVTVWAWVASFLLVLVTATSRIYLGVHYASDVVAAAALGATWLALASTAWLAWDRLGASPALRTVRDRAARTLVKSGLLAASLGILLHVVLLALPGIRQSVSALRHANVALVAAALVAEVGSNAALAGVYRRSLRAMGPTIGYREALRTSMGMFTVGHVLPAGGATAGVWGTRQLTRLGIDTPTATTSVVVGGSLGVAVLGVIVFVGAAVSLLRGELSGAYVAGIGMVLLLLAALGVAVWKAVHSETLRHRMVRLAEAALSKIRVKKDLAGWSDATDAMVQRLAGKGEVLAISRRSAANWLLDAAALWLMFLAFGYRMHVGVLLVGYGVANLVNALPLTPGGLGLVEAGLAGTYTAFGVPGPIAIVAVLAYRLVSFWLPIVAGMPAYLGAGRVPDADPVEAGV